MLVDVAGLSYREAGRALGVPEATVTTRLHRARRRVATELQPAEKTGSEGRAEHGGEQPRALRAGGPAVPCLSAS